MFAEKTPQLHFQGDHYVSSSESKTNTTWMSVVITMGMSFTKYQIITFIHIQTQLEQA